MMASSAEHENPSLSWLSENELGVANGLLETRLRRLIGFINKGYRSLR